jgi:hypothetical protein
MALSDSWRFLSIGGSIAIIIKPRTERKKPQKNPWVALPFGEPIAMPMKPKTKEATIIITNSISVSTTHSRLDNY